MPIDPNNPISKISLTEYAQLAIAYALLCRLVQTSPANDLADQTALKIGDILRMANEGFDYDEYDPIDEHGAHEPISHTREWKD